MYLKGTVANTHWFWQGQTNRHAWLHHIPPRGMHIQHGLFLPSHSIFSLTPLPCSRKHLCASSNSTSLTHSHLSSSPSLLTIFYLASTGRIWGVINSLNFKFQVSNRNVKILKSSRLSHHKPCGCCTVSPQKLFALLTHMRGLTCRDLSSETQIFIDGTEVFQLLFLLLIILTLLLKRLWNIKSLSLFCSRTILFILKIIQLWDQDQNL